MKKTNIGVWQVRPINYTNEVQTKIARWVKTHPEELLPEYDCSVWIDANMNIMDKDLYLKIIDLYHARTLVAAVKHFCRDCIYEEMYTALKSNIEKENIIIRWGRYLKRNKYPQSNGLHETGILYRLHSDVRVSNFDKYWWNYIVSYSRRDQLSFDFVLWKQKIDCEYFLPENTNARNSKMINIVGVHKNAKNRIVVNNWDDTLLMRYCYNYSNEIVKKAYHFVYSMPFPMTVAKILGQCFNIRAKLKYIFKS